MKLCEITMFALVILLALSLGWNVLRKPCDIANADPEIVTVIDTLIVRDTVLKVVTNRIVIEKPMPVAADSGGNVKTYRDTIFHEYGTIRREEVVFGDLLSKNIEFDLKIPEITKTLTINTVSTHYLRRSLFFATVGVQSDFKGTASPTIGWQYIPKDHRMSVSYDYSPLNNRHNVVLGLGLFR